MLVRRAIDLTFLQLFNGLLNAQESKPQQQLDRKVSTRHPKGERTPTRLPSTKMQGSSMLVPLTLFHVSLACSSEAKSRISVSATKGISAISTVSWRLRRAGLVKMDVCCSIKHTRVRKR